MSEALTVIEQTNLAELEGTITKHLNAFCGVGFALMQIRDNRLYRVHYTTFEEYCKTRWNFTANYARRLIASSEVMDNIKNVPTGTIPQSERTIRSLTSLPPDQQREAYQKAVAAAPEGKLTSKHVEEAVEEITGKKKTSETKEPGKKKEDSLKNIRSAPEIMSDEFIEAYGAMRKALVNASGEHWKTTSQETAVKYINNLLHMTTK